jgi:hypothetical protein
MCVDGIAAILASSIHDMSHKDDMTVRQPVPIP